MVMASSDSSPQALRPPQALTPRNLGGPACTRAAPLLRGNRRGGSWWAGPLALGHCEGEEIQLGARKRSGQVPHSVHCRLRGQQRDGETGQILIQRSWVKKMQPAVGQGHRENQGRVCRPNDPSWSVFSGPRWARALSWTDSSHTWMGYPGPLPWCGGEGGLSSQAV